MAKTHFVFGGRDTVESTPQHQHDCSRCVFLGRLGTGDLYRCESPLGASYIVRHSSDGPDYYSSCDFEHREETALRECTEGGTDLYFWRMTLLRICGTGVGNLIQ